MSRDARLGYGGTVLKSSLSNDAEAEHGEARVPAGVQRRRRGMFMRRRRPIARAAMVGGAAYAVGKSRQRGQTQEEEQEYRLQELEAQQAAAAAPAPQYAPPPPAPSAGGITDETVAQLQKLGQLKEQGILTQEEFDAQKAKLLGLS